MKTWWKTKKQLDLQNCVQSQYLNPNSSSSFEWLPSSWSWCRRWLLKISLFCVLRVIFTKDIPSVGHGHFFRDSLSVWFGMAGKFAYILLRTDVYCSFPSSIFPVWKVFFFTKIKPSNEISDDPSECKRKTIEPASISFLTHEIGHQHVHEKGHRLHFDLGQKWAFGGLPVWAVLGRWRWKG